jgi:hypothetical protein
MCRLNCKQTVAGIVSVLMVSKIAKPYRYHGVVATFPRHVAPLYAEYWTNPPSQVVPGRMAMLITLFLVLINIFNIVTTNSPNVEGMTAIAAWMLVCIFFVFGALGNQSLTHLTQSINQSISQFSHPIYENIVIFFLYGKYGTRISFYLIWVHFPTPAG